MDLQQLLIKSGELGGMPYVKVDKPVKGSSKKVGIVKEITKHGISVRFPDMGYDTWFWVNPDLNSMKKTKYYMHQLEFYEKIDPKNESLSDFDKNLKKALDYKR